MKTLTKPITRNIALRALVLTVVLTRVITVVGQLPDCVSGTVMYSAFSNTSTITDSTEIRSVNYATGALGPLMGNRRYFIRKNPGGGGTFFYGTAGLAVDAITNRFYLMTQMSSSTTNDGPKDIISIDPVAPTATGTVIATTPASLDKYHFVKVAVAPNGFGYAIGVNWDSTSAASTFNPLIRFAPCGTAGCANATFMILGYLPSTGNMYKWLLYNGDIAFNSAGDLYFFSAAYERVGAIGKYTDARLFRINAANIPTVAGAGTIPMSFVADYNVMDSTGCSGMAFDPTGKMYFTVKRFTNNDPTSTFVTQLYKSASLGSATLMAGFGPLPVSPTTGATLSAGDIASCYFPAAILASNKIQLSGHGSGSLANLFWDVNNNTEAAHFEIEQSMDGNNFETVGHVEPTNVSQPDQKYPYSISGRDGGRNTYYRVKEILKSGAHFYSNIITVSAVGRVSLSGNISPNPFINTFSLTIQLKSANVVNLRVIDQNGRPVREYHFNCAAGENKLTAGDLAALRTGVYIAEISIDGETVRQKVVRQ